MFSCNILYDIASEQLDLLIGVLCSMQHSRHCPVVIVLYDNDMVNWSHILVRL